MSNQKVLKDIHEIKKMINRSGRFLSLSGLSGILAGIYALIGSVIAYKLLYRKTLYLRSATQENLLLTAQLIALAIIVAIMAIVTAWILTKNKAKKDEIRIWNETTKIMMIHFIIPLISGGIFGLILLYHEHFGIIAPITLIFYGLALLNASKYTLDTVKYLGISEIITGLFAAYFIGYGLFFWAFGFGILHITYGSIMYYKEKSNQM